MSLTERHATTDTTAKMDPPRCIPLRVISARTKIHAARFILPVEEEKGNFEGTNQMWEEVRGQFLHQHNRCILTRNITVGKIQDSVMPSTVFAMAPEMAFSFFYAKFVVLVLSITRSTVNRSISSGAASF
jgi:hypothetical protein